MSTVVSERLGPKYKVADAIYASAVSNADKRDTYDQIAADYDAMFGDAVAYRVTADIMMEHLPSVNASVLDVGCGTGLLGTYVRGKPNGAKLKLIGLDYSAGMLREAEKTAAFDSLLQRDITSTFDLAGDSPVDVAVAAGVFLEGHVSPDAMVYVAEHVRKGGIMIISIREATYDATKDAYHAMFDKCACKLLKVIKSEYWPRGGTKGYYAVLQREE